MGREIKFRAWDKEMKTWYVWGLGVNPFGAWFTSPPKDGLTHCQFTGLHDKNGKEIYEGDIIEAMGLLVPYKIHVTFDVERGAYHLAREYSTAEVIGNIYENPELIK